MGATVLISETNGPSGSPTETSDISNVNFGSAALAELVPSSYMVTAKVDGHSYEKWLRIYVSDMGGSTQVDNFKVWLSNLGGGWEPEEAISCNLVTVGYSAATYPAAGPVETDSTVAVEVMPESEPVGPNIGISGLLAGAITVAPEYSDYLVLQLDVGELTGSGSVNTKTIVFQWDEF